MDETSKAQVMALVRYHLSKKQGTRILVNPYTQVRESRRKGEGEGEGGGNIVTRRTAPALCAPSARMTAPV